MTVTIAVAGKGGVGKTTFASLMVLSLPRNRGVILAVDADPNTNLNEKLGVELEGTMGDLREDVRENIENIPAGMSKTEYIQYHIQTLIAEGENFDLIGMGRPEGPGCYCYINSVLRTFLDGVSEKYGYVVIDNEAGMEHLSRRTTKKMDYFFVVSDVTRPGVETADRIHRTAREMGIDTGTSVLVLNRINTDKPNRSQSRDILSILPKTLSQSVESAGFDTVGFIPFDSQIERLNTEGKPLTGLNRRSVAVRAVSRMLKELGI